MEYQSQFSGKYKKKKKKKSCLPKFYPAYKALNGGNCNVISFHNAIDT